MSKPNGGGFFKNFMWVVFATGVGVSFHGGCLVAEWKLAGGPDLEELPQIWAMMEKGSEGSLEAADDPATAGSGPGGARVSAPIEATEAVYQQYMAREDVLVLVEYYADW